jgi:hypothetical protein
MERIITSRLEGFVETNDILDEEQEGFRHYNPMLVLNHSPSVLLTKHFASLSSKNICIHFHIFPCIPDLNNFTYKLSLQTQS